MSRKTRKSPRPAKKVTDTVTAASATPTAMQSAAAFDKLLGSIGVFGGATADAPAGKPKKQATIKQKEAAFAVIEDDVMEAMDHAASVGKRVGRIEGLQRGLSLPRTPGELRVVKQESAVSAILQEVFAETKKAISKHGPMHSGHEGFAVIREELDELWDEIKAGRGRQLSARAEAIQVAAMAVRYALDIDPH